MTRIQQLVFSLALLGLAAPGTASAFCGFYVTGADTSLYANATMTVLMRSGTRTVLSMQNNYQGPPEAFALVIPVPMVLQKEQVKTLPKEVFSRVDTLSAPRLVEYWEVDPCQPQIRADAAGAVPGTAVQAPSAAGNSAVTIEAQFTVGEYEVVILGANDSSALDGWLRDNKYNIPDGAEPVLKPYVAAGMKFFVAKVDPAKVQFQNGQAALSPLRFYYDTQEFSLPVRLGLLNSQGTQDLIVNILAPTRYELANYPNVTVPTNIRVQNEVRDDFGSFYEALFSRVLEKQPRAVVTEYSWAASSCDPCPTPPLTPTDLATLGADVLQSAGMGGAGGNGGAPPPIVGGNPYGFTLTRLHARYTKDSLGEDLVFKQAPAIMGGRGIPDAKGNLDQTVTSGQGFDNFQGRYVILHPWEKEITCQTPQRGQWGGPSGMPNTAPGTMPSMNTALRGAAPKAGDLASLVAESVPALDVTAKKPVAPLGAAGSGGKPAAAGSGGKSATTGSAGKPATTGSGGKLAAAGSGDKAAAGSGPAAGTSGPTQAPAPNAAPQRSSSCGSCSPGVVRGDGALGWLGLFAGTLLVTRLRRRRAS